MKLDRREAMKLLAAGGAVLGLPSVLTGTVFAAAGPDLAVITGDDPAKNVAAAIEAMGGIGRFVSKGDKVVIKPNMGFGNAPNAATTTDPRVVRAIAEIALGAGAKRVMIFDNPCHKPDIVLEMCGIKKEVAPLHDTFVYLVRGGDLFREVQIPKGKTLKKQSVAKDLLEADTIINVPMAKSHGGAMVSFSMKAWMGVVENRKPWHVWYDLHQAIADLSTFIRPKLILLDATRALVTGGPGGPGEVAYLRTIVAGIDPVAVDAYGATMAKWGGKGYKPEQIPHIVKAAELGVGRYHLAQMNILKKAI